MRAMRRLAAYAALAVFALRALLPSGYMPDLTALASTGHLGFIVCTAAHGDAPAAPQKTVQDECPFGMALGQGFVPPAAPSVRVQFAAERAIGAVPHAAGPPAVAQGPPLGQRGPPILLT